MLTIDQRILRPYVRQVFPCTVELRLPIKQNKFLDIHLVFHRQPGCASLRQKTKVLHNKVVRLESRDKNYKIDVK